MLIYWKGTLQIFPAGYLRLAIGVIPNKHWLAVFVWGAEGELHFCATQFGGSMLHKQLKQLA